MSEPTPMHPVHGKVKKCPLCHDEPFIPFLYGQVVRWNWFGLRKKVYALICLKCKDIVGYDEGPPWRGDTLIASLRDQYSKDEPNG